MPLMKIDLIKGRSQSEVKEILDISYQVMLKAFPAPQGGSLSDCYSTRSI